SAAEVRPLAADCPLRVRPKSWLRLEARTSYHKLPLGLTSGGGPSRLRPLAVSTFLCRGSHATTPCSRSAIAAPLRRRHRHLPLRPLRRLPPGRPPARRG